MRNFQRKRCGAKTRDGDACKSWAMPNGRCRMHGGKSLAGVASPAFKTGIYSKYLPVRLLDRYEESLRDNEVLALRNEIALVDTRIAELITRLDSGESGALWKSLRDRMDDFDRAQRHMANIKDEEKRKEKSAEAAEALSDIRNMISRGAADYQMWYDLGFNIEQRRKLVESEQKRLVAMQQMITAERAMTYAAALGQAVADIVKDREQLRLINDKFRSLMSRNDITNITE